MLKRRLINLSRRLAETAASRGSRYLNLLIERTHDTVYFEELHRKEFFRRAFYALAFNDIAGDYAEFGSHGAMTFALAYRASRISRSERKLWAFDSFSGLPPKAGQEDEHPVWVEGDMAMSLDEFIRLCEASRIPPSSYYIVPGFYQDTLTRPASDGAGLPSDIALAYIDCDMYSSTRLVLEFLIPRLKHGMIIAFDDYYCWSSTAISGERKALIEVFAKETRYHLLPYVQIGWHGMSFVVEDSRLLGEGTDRIGF